MSSSGEGTRNLSLARAARMVGVTRGALQKRMRDGDLSTFEGMISLHDLQRVFPQAVTGGDAFLEKLTRIKDEAFAHRLRERVVDPDVLIARLTELGREVAATRAEVQHYRTAVDRLREVLGQIEQGGDAGSRGIIRSLRRWFEDELREELISSGSSEQWVIKETFLRVMAANVHLLPSGHEFLVEGTDSVLEAGVHSGLALEYGCASGNCGQCRARLVSGDIKKIRPHDYVLTEEEKRQGVFLMCAHTAVSDLVLEAGEAGSANDIPVQHIPTHVKEVKALGEGTWLLHVQTPRSKRLRFLAGQSARLALSDGTTTTLPIASCPCDDRNLEFHVRPADGDHFAAAVSGRIKPNDLIAIEGPQGGFALDDDSSRPVIFLAFDAGFAPVKSLMEHAMALEQAESLTLYWLATPGQGHYLDNLCRAWSDALDHVYYTPLFAAPDAAASTAAGVIAAACPALAEVDLYIAGPESLAQDAAALLERAGARRDRIRVGAV